MMTAENWQERALCMGAWDLFFGPVGETKRQRDVRDTRAIATCARCPVLRQCLDAEDALPTRHGVVAGMTAEHRITRANVGRGAPGVKRSTCVGGKLGPEITKAANRAAEVA